MLAILPHWQIIYGREGERIQHGQLLNSLFASGMATVCIHLVSRLPHSIPPMTIKAQVENIHHIHITLNSTAKG